MIANDKNLHKRSNELTITGHRTALNSEQNPNRIISMIYMNKLKKKRYMTVAIKTKS